MTRLGYHCVWQIVVRTLHNEHCCKHCSATGDTLMHYVTQKPPTTWLMRSFTSWRLSAKREPIQYLHNELFWWSKGPGAFLWSYLHWLHPPTPATKLGIHSRAFGWVGEGEYIRGVKLWGTLFMSNFIFSKVKGKWKCWRHVIEILLSMVNFHPLHSNVSLFKPNGLCILYCQCLDTSNFGAPKDFVLWWKNKL